MTNYNERLDETRAEIREILFSYRTPSGPNLHESIEDAMAEITSLIKELVAEAKPINKQGEIDIDVPAYNDGYYSGANNALEKFEQNLLKALEEV